eukprot:COSAG04_NODE_609_length_12066_cov_55.131695_5_plen_400_part_00
MTRGRLLLRQALSSRPAGGVWAMGRNDYGELGLGEADDDAHPTAAQLAALDSGVVQVAAGSGFSAALTAGGEVYLWGENRFGQMANGECSTWTNSGGETRCSCHACLAQDVAAPARVAALGTDTVQLALGSSHALALKQGGAVFSWGLGGQGALGLGDGANRLSPTEITGLGTDNACIAAQANGGMALKSDGRLFNWGYNYYNNLGDGTTTGRSSPTELAAVGSDNAHVVGGQYHALLLKADGSVLSWGSNSNGQIGNGECSCVHGASWCADNAPHCTGSSHQVCSPFSRAHSLSHGRTSCQPHPLVCAQPCPAAGDAGHRLRPPLRRGADRGWVHEQLRHARGRQRLGLGCQLQRAARRRLRPDRRWHVAGHLVRPPQPGADRGLRRGQRDAPAARRR